MSRVLPTVPAALFHAAQRFGDAQAIADPRYGVRHTYAELHGRVRGVAQVLIDEGVRPGDRVAICSPNTYHWVEAALGILYAGATLVPINTRFTGPETLDVIRRSGTRALFVAGRFLGTDRLAELRAAGSPGLRPVIRIP